MFALRVVVNISTVLTEFHGLFSSFESIGSHATAVRSPVFFRSLLKQDALLLFFLGYRHTAMRSMPVEVLILIFCFRGIVLMGCQSMLCLLIGMLIFYFSFVQIHLPASPPLLFDFSTARALEHAYEIPTVGPTVMIVPRFIAGLLHPMMRTFEKPENAIEPLHALSEPRLH